MIKEKNNEVFEKDYFKDLQEIKEAIRTNQNKAMVIVNSAMIMTYYEIGTIINKRKTWGSKYIKNLANDLKEYGKGYSERNLQRMMKFSSEFSYSEITTQVVAKIPWGMIDTIMQKSSTHEEMLWYINETHKNGWSRSMVLNQIALKAYERSLIEPTTSSITKSDDLSNELFKDTYVFDFLDKNNIKSEKDLKEIKEAIRTNQNKAMVVVNSAMIMTYYEIGTIINKRKTWGSKYIKNLANDLKEYGKGYSYENLYRMSKVSEEFSNEEIMSHPVTQIPWSALVTVIMAKSSSHEEL